jgi:hemoglobin
MKRFNKLFTVLVCLGLVPAIVGARGNADKAIEENKAMDSRVRDAFTRKDVQTIMSFYWKSPSLVVVFPNASIQKGWDNVKTTLEGYLNSLEAIEFSDVRTDYRISGDVVTVFSTLRSRVRLKDGSVEEGLIITTSQRQKIGKDWFIVHEHMSMPMAHQGPQPSDSLYKRLGGYDAIAAVTDDLLARMATDPTIAPLLRGVNESRLKKIRQLLVDMLCEITGGPCIYTGADMATAHAGLGIKDSEWRRFMSLLDQTLDKFQVPDRERGEVRAMIAGMRPLIVTQ